MNSIVLKLIAGNVVKRLRISTEDFDYKDLMAAAALSIPNGDLFFFKRRLRTYDENNCQ
tara:strand:+ start:92 stop:268 length:177 start_codon:yes stop_codon:yes gene_type:complete